MLLVVAGCGDEGIVGLDAAPDAGRDDATSLDRAEPASDRVDAPPAPLDQPSSLDVGVDAPRDVPPREELPPPEDATARDAANDATARDARPGGWRAATYVFSAAAMRSNDRADDRVELGWIETDADRPAVTTCGGTGPWTRRSFHRWSHNGYPRGDCAQDIIRGVAFRRWDHVAVRVDDCPGAGSWSRNGSPTAESFLRSCPAHVPAGFGQSAQRITWTGRYTHDPARGQLVFHYDTPEGCQREYYRDLTVAPDGALVSMTLDGALSRDTGTRARGLGNTRGYAYGSSTGIATAAPFREAIAALADPARTFLEDAWHLREADSAPGADGDHDQVNDPLGLRPRSCREGVAFDHSCGSQPGEQPYLRECAAAGAGRTANLRFLIDAFAPRRAREMLFWEWFAHHAGDWSGCYHNGSHARPVLQIVDANGRFRGLVGVEIQRSQRTVASGGGYAADPDGYLHTDYRVFRWIERGLQERPAP
jgi:hypothetical protein